MSRRTFPDLFASASCHLGEGAVIERLRRNPALELDPYMVNAAFIYTAAPSAALETICRQYLEIGRDSGLPLLLSTPTWRASRERIAAAGFDGIDVNGDNVRFLDTLRHSYGGYAAPFRGIRSHPIVLRTHDVVRQIVFARDDSQFLPAGCYTGACTCAFVEALDRFPREVRELAIYSRSDGVVDWRMCVTGEAAKDREVLGTHVGLAFNPFVYRWVAEFLAEQAASVRVA